MAIEFLKSVSYLTVIVCLFLSASISQAQDRLVPKLKTPQTEAEEVIAHLKNEIAANSHSYTKYLTTYAIPPEKRDDYVLVTSFILHSLVGPSNDIDNNGAGFKPLATRTGKVFFPKQRVPGSDTLWYLDLRDYGFTEQAWEKAAALDGYFAEPIVQPPTSGALRLLSGNALLRMDWFVNQVIDSTRQQDIDAETRSLYDEFVFGNVGVPKTAEEWWTKLGLNRTKARANGNASYVLVSKSKQVARHNRILEEYRTENGYAYESYDVKNQEGLRNYVNAFFKNKTVGGPPPVSDAGEMFASNHLGLQVYGLRDQNNNLVNFGDPTVVRHLSDVLGDVRVRNPYSCIDCHAGGPIPSENTLVEFLKEEGKIYLKNKRDENRLKRTYLDGRFEDNTQDNQTFFARKLLRTNGLEPEENGKLFLDLITWYNSAIDVKRAAHECGVTEAEFTKAVIKDKYGGRLKLLVTTGEPIPIDSWDSRGKEGIPGDFQQAMILLHGLTKITETVEEAVIVDGIVYEVIEEANIQVGTKIIEKIKAGEKIKFIGEPRTENGWIKYNDGWINSKSVKRLSK